MYGLIHSSLKDMINEKYGEEIWQEVLASSGVPDASFLAMRSYDDEIIYSLVVAASEVLNAPADACLEMFGEYWVLETASKSYGMLLDAAGNDMLEFLGNMNSLHDRISSTFINYVPPEFHIEKTDNGHLIHYVSKRKGLTPFVVGILKGLAIRFSSPLNILDQVEVEVDEGTHTIFQIELAPK
ncbi:guanylyl cyclase [Halieaceae bacterium IMCC14734]|uniref:Guanylyl cyclase n=1 Tax=Candidatus Litorirhabdus singularis TaxID=2518993 RepID=A0ABT3TEA6_9GAMM|nr:heme NO-binding domain-containing protein [Candidatus Litorirhabdus singularis]MCX2980589.1 guanylyl cyclase [Candidatus Litorirhabdus singularis]